MPTAEISTPNCFSVIIVGFWLVSSVCESILCPTPGVCNGRDFCKMGYQVKCVGMQEVPKEVPSNAMILSRGFLSIPYFSLPAIVFYFHVEIFQAILCIPFMKALLEVFMS